MRKLITELVECRYDLGTVTDVYEIFGGFNNRNFGVVVDKDGHMNRYVVRKYKEGIGPEEIRFEHALIRHAMESGLTMGADVLENRDGDTLVLNDAETGIFAIYEYLQGEDKFSWDNPNLTDIEFQNAARVLADFHNTVRNFEPGEKKRKEPPILALLPNMADRLVTLAASNRGGSFHTCYAEHLDGIQDTIARIRFAPDLIDNLPVIPTHYDYHPGNLKWDKEQVVGIFDFDWSKIDLRLFDLCMACVYFCTSWWGATDGELRFEKFSLFLRSYQHRLSELKGLTPLRDAEQQLLPDMLTAATIYLIHWIADDYFQKDDACDQQYQIYLTHSIRLMRWLEAHRPEIESRVSLALTS